MRRVLLLCLVVAMTLAVATIPGSASAGSADDCENNYWVCWINCENLYWPNDLDRLDRCTANCDHAFLRCLHG